MSLQIVDMSGDSASDSGNTELTPLVTQQVHVATAEDPMRIGLAGAGRIGARHAETLRNLPEVESVVIADVDAERARALAGKHGAQVADTVDDLFPAGLDGLLVDAATDAHAELLPRSSASGLPSFCENPVAPDIVGTLQVINAVKRSGCPVQVGIQRR